MKILNSDLDNVLYDFVGALALVEGYDCKETWMAEKVNTSGLNYYGYVKRMFDGAIDKGLFTIGKPLPDAVQLLDHLTDLKKEHGFMLNLLGACPHNHPKSDKIIKDKTEWLEKYNLVKYFDQIIFTNGSKSKVNHGHPYSLLIDDYEVTEKRFAEINAPFILHTTTENTIVELKKYFGKV